jgi:hypothetical protein
MFLPSKTNPIINDHDKGSISRVEGISSSNCVWFNLNCNLISTPESPWSNSNLNWKWAICTPELASNFSCLQLNLLVWLQYQVPMNHTRVPHPFLVCLCQEGMFSKYANYEIQQQNRRQIDDIRLRCFASSSGWFDGRSGGFGGATRLHPRHHLIV